MCTSVSLYSNDSSEIQKFLDDYFETPIKIDKKLKWEKTYENPIEIADIIGVFIDNNDKYKLNMWISLDKGYYIYVTNNNANNLIKYLFERYPY